MYIYQFYSWNLMTVCTDDWLRWRPVEQNEKPLCALTLGLPGAWSFRSVASRKIQALKSSFSVQCADIASILIYEN